MRLIALAVAVLAGFAAIGAHAAERTAWDDFRDICADTRADKDKMLDVMDLKWFDAFTPAKYKARTLLHRSRMVGDEMRELVLLQSPLKAGTNGLTDKASIRICILSSNAPGADAKLATQAWIGRAPTTSDAEGDAWFYFEERGGRRFLTQPPSPADTNAGLQKGPFVMIKAAATPQGTALGYTEVSLDGR